MRAQIALRIRRLWENEGTHRLFQTIGQVPRVFGYTDHLKIACHGCVAPTVLHPFWNHLLRQREI